MSWITPGWSPEARVLREVLCLGYVRAVPYGTDTLTVAEKFPKAALSTKDRGIALVNFQIQLRSVLFTFTFRVSSLGAPVPGTALATSVSQSVSGNI
jgi:hypothetical protein